MHSNRFIAAMIKKTSITEIMFQQRIHFPFFLEQGFQLRPVLDHATGLALPEDAFHLLVAEVRMAHQGLEIVTIDVDFPNFGRSY